MRWGAALAYLVAGGIGTLAAAVMGIYIFIVLNNFGHGLLVCLALVALTLTVAGVMGFFSPLKAATLAFRSSLAGLAVTAIGSVLMFAGQLFQGPDDKFEVKVWFWLMVAPSILLAISLWTSRRVLSAERPAGA